MRRIAACPGDTGVFWDTIQRIIYEINHPGSLTHTGYNSVLLPLSGDFLRRGLGYPWTVHLSPGIYGNRIWPTHQQSSLFFPGRVCPYRRGIHPFVACNVALSACGASLAGHCSGAAIVACSVYLSDDWHSVDFIGGSALRNSTEPFPFEISSGTSHSTFSPSRPGRKFGWRGTFTLPLLQRKFAPIWAGLILSGAIWGLWHLPAFLLSGTQQSEWSFTAFFAGCLAISVIATALFNRSRGSILLSAFFHFSLMNPIFPDAQPYDTYMLILAAILIVWWNRRNMFSREASVTKVIPCHEKATDD